MHLKTWKDRIKRHYSGLIAFIFFFYFLMIIPVFSFQLISESQEINIGKQAAVELEQKYGLYNNQKELVRINKIGKKIVEVCDRKNLPYSFKILNTDTVNAFCCPGGFIYITKGLLNLGVSEDELACVLAHETAHAVKRHAVKQIESSMGIGVLLNLLSKGQSQRQLTYQVMQILLSRGYSRESEYEADENGCWYAFTALYDAHAMLGFLNRLKNLEGSGKMSIGLFSTHPDTDGRIQRIKSYLVRVYGK